MVLVVLYDRKYGEMEKGRTRSIVEDKEEEEETLPDEEERGKENRESIRVDQSFVLKVQ